MPECEVDLTSDDRVQLDWTMRRDVFNTLKALADVTEGHHESPMNTVGRLVDAEFKRLNTENRWP